MAKIKKTIVAGPLVIEAVYPALSPRDPEAVRQGKKHLSSQAQQRLNLKNAYRKLELLLAANFVHGDLWLTLTYDDAHLPASRGEAMAQVRKFFRKLRARRKDGSVRYIYCTEHRHGDGRWHHHMMLNYGGEDYAELQALWGQGFVIGSPIKIDREHTYEALARYMCKEQRDKVGQRLWSCARGLNKPEIDTQRVPNDLELSAPDGAAVLEDTGDVVTVYGHYRYLKYMAQGFGEAQPRRRRHRPRRSRRFL